MSFFKKVLASVGVGSATVDTILDRAHYVAGETMSGRIEITGGSVEQKIDKLIVNVCATYIREADDNEYTDTAVVTQHIIPESFTIGEGEKKTLTFSFQLPEDTPVTFGKTRVWVQTDLDIKNAIDPNDKDYIEISPDSILSAVLDGMNQLGFNSRKEECKKASYHLRGKYPFIQEFECIPVSGSYRGRLDEVEIMVLDINNERAELLLQVDRRARGLASFLSEALDMDESFVRLTVTKSDLPHISSILNDTIARYT